MARRRRRELFGTGVFPHDGASRFDRSEYRQILGDHFLFAAEAAADALGEHVNVALIHTEEIREFGLDDERRLRTRPHLEASVVASPRERRVGFEMDVLHAAGGIRPFVHDLGRFEAGGNTANFAVKIEVDVRLGTHSAGIAALIVEHRRTGFHCAFGIEDVRQHFVIDFERAAALFGRAFVFGNDRRDALTDEPHDVVEDVHVVGIDQMIFVQRRAVELTRNVFPRVHVDDAGTASAFVCRSSGYARGRAPTAAP